MTNTKLSLTINDQGEHVKTLHENLLKLGYKIPQHENYKQLFAIGTQDALLRFHKKYKLRHTGKLDEHTEDAIYRAVSVVDSGQNKVDGLIYFDNGIPSGGIKLRFYSHGFSSANRPVGEVKT